MAQGFRLLKETAQDEFENVRIASQAYTIGDAVMFDVTSDAIDVVPATAATLTARIYGVAMETVTSAATSMLICKVTPWQKWTADAANTVNTNHNYLRMLLSDKATVNNTTDNTTTSAVFQQTGVVGTLRIVGRFLVGFATT